MDEERKAKRRALSRTLTGPVAPAADHHWRWRLEQAERLSRALDRRRFGVVDVYLIGSSKNATAAAASDIDLVVHVRNTDRQQLALRTWLEEFGRCLAVVNRMRTGHISEQMLDVHYVTDEDLDKRSSYAVMIGAVTDGARKLPEK